MAKTRSLRTAQRWWVAGIALSIAAVALRAVAPARGPHNALERVAVLGIAVAITGLVGWLTLAAYNRGESKLPQAEGPDAWAHRCVDPDNPQAWRSVVVSDESLTILGLRNRVHSRWALKDIAGVAVTPVRIGLVEHTGLTIALHDGSQVRIALPSRSTFSYPTALAQGAQQEIQRRLDNVRA